MAKTKTTHYDIAEHLRTEEEMALYLEAALEETDSDPTFIAKALGDIARARGMTQVAEDAGLSRESLYKALSGERSPEFSTIMKVSKALGLRWNIQPMTHAKQVVLVTPQHSQLPVFRPEIRHCSHLTPPAELPASAVPPPRRFCPCLP